MRHRRAEPSTATRWLAVTLAVAVTPGTLGVDVLSAGLALLRGAAERGRLLRQESLVSLRAARGLLHALADAVDEGLLDEVTAGLADVRTAVALMEKVSQQLDQAMPVLHATTPTLGMVNATLAQLDATVSQLDALPGVRLARRFVGRPPAPGAAQLRVEAADIVLETHG